MDWKQIIVGVIVGAILGIASTAFLFQERISKLETQAAQTQSLSPTSISAATNIASRGKVEVSSISTADQGECQQGSKAVDGDVGGYPDASCSEWSTNGELGGAWIKITFPDPVHINQITLYDRPNTTDHIVGGTIEFSDGTAIKTAPLPNNGSALKYPFDSTKAIRWVKFTINQAEGANIGLSEMELHGWLIR